MTLDQTEYMTTGDVAKFTRAPEATVRYWRHMGTGPVGFKRGRRVLYARSAVEVWLRDLQERDAALQRPA